MSNHQYSIVFTEDEYKHLKKVSFDAGYTRLNHFIRVKIGLKKSVVDHE